MKHLLLTLFLLAPLSLSAQSSDGEFSVTKKFYDDSLGSRLVVRPEVRQDSRASDLELRILDERYFDPHTSRFVLREIATLQGGGLSSPGLLFHVDNPESREQMIQLLEEFLDKAERFRNNEGTIRDMEESWMGDPENSLSQSRILTEIETDFTRRPLEVTLNWNVQTNRLWLSLGGLLNIDSRVAEPLLQLIQNIPTYSRQREDYREEVAQRNRQIDETLAVQDNPQN